MEKSKIYSFSAKTKADKDLVDRLKAKYARQGIKFSYIVLKALAELEANEEAGAKANEQ